jgi:hypothetical protein
MGAALLSLLVYPTFARVLFSKTEGQAQSGGTGGAARRRGQ